MKYASQVTELEEISKRTGFTIDELADRTGINPKTLRNAFSGAQKLGEHKMYLLRNAGSVPVYDQSALNNESGTPQGAPLRRLRYIPVVSWAQAGVATVYEDLPTEWMERIASDTDDPQAFGVTIAGDSMEPEYKEGQTAILVPGQQARNGDVVVAKLKKGGIVMKLFHTMNGGKVKLTSYNPAYPETIYSEKDFHWIYVVDHVIRRVRR